MHWLNSPFRRRRYNKLMRMIEVWEYEDELTHAEDLREIEKLKFFQVEERPMQIDDLKIEVQKTLSEYLHAITVFDRTEFGKKLLTNLTNLVLLMNGESEKAIPKEPEEPWITPFDFWDKYRKFGKPGSIINAIRKDPVATQYCALKEEGNWLIKERKTLFYFSTSEKNPKFRKRAIEYINQENKRKIEETTQCQQK
jgi:hypothetical protein